MVQQQMFEFRTPWHPCDDACFEEELKREISERHVLFGIEARIVARRHDLDDFLFRLNDGRYASVHLTWSRESDPGSPDTEIYESLEVMQSEVQQHIDDWNKP